MADALRPSGAVQAQSARRTVRLSVLVVAGLFVLAVALWTRYGGAVFVEMLATAWSACF